ncbi:MAG: SDR family NAD(P)-dependent oxidoreductase [Chlorobium sp.]|uniref:SDR family NAD(P)-dependent oxidoreductase n=1 Tax=Chlorobium sp. TaxID=1095 RepID=UPI0025C0F3D2|nr:SDR family NAD(P)-dependent oxidoreductase [Chlorobium sp.]MCF8382477.1 SDR family NAD(P)-dependent oxidoreductase [Chlorobium sp.]
MSKVVLVTGASGFIGSHLVRRSLGDGYQVRALVRKGNARNWMLQQLGAEIVEGDIRDPRAVARAVKGCDLVFHAAALTSDWGTPQDFADINVGGTRNVAIASLESGVKRLVYVSSFEVFDHVGLERLDESMPFSLRGQLYPDTKIRATKVVREFAAKGLSASVVYPVWVYGPDDRTLFPLLADGIRKGQLFYWAFHARMSLVYIDNLVDLLMLAATHPAAAGEAFLGCDGYDLTFEGFCRRLASGIGSPPPFIYLPYGLTLLIAAMMEGYAHISGSEKRPLLTSQAVNLLSSRALIDSSKARNLLGWQPKVSLDDGFRRTLDWLMGIDPSEWKAK